MRPPTPSLPIRVLISLFLFKNRLLEGVVGEGIIDCSTTAECKSLVHESSECVKGFCSLNKNPFEQGCLYNKLPDWKKVRVCNSEDSPDAEKLGICIKPTIDYMEIRMKCQDWESALFNSWILQIVFSEILGVPATLENSLPNAVMNFYDPDARYEWGTSTDSLSAFTNALEVGGDCRKVSKDPDNYQKCAHIIPEVWTARTDRILDLVHTNVLDPPSALGALGIEGWYMPRYTAERKPALLNYLGLRGEKNRQMLADTFLRPTKWKDYCDQVSPNNCETDDGVAKRPPHNESEYGRFFVYGVYEGHFRKTEKNDCSLNPNCTGHIGDFPCGWSGYTEAQIYHLGIALESDGDEPNCHGYTYSQLAEMWAAANASKTDIVIQFSAPDPAYELYLGSDAEFIRVTLPPPNQECVENRVQVENRCSERVEDRIGIPVGACDDTPRPLSKLSLRKLYDLTRGPSIPEAMWSPGYDVLNLYSITEHQMSQMFGYMQSLPTPREAICQWAVDNFEFMMQFVPRTYPRTLQHEQKPMALLYTCTVMGGIAGLLVIGTGLKVYQLRGERFIKHAQVEFLYMLLFGSICIAVGAILKGIEPTNDSCMAQIWLISLGYTFELVPLLIKVAAINKLMNAAQRMKRVQLKREFLYGSVLFISILISGFLLCWTVLDPPQKVPEYELTQEINEEGETIVKVSYHCSSDSNRWEYIAVGWNVILLICATAIAFQTRHVKQAFNESRILSRLIYSHFVFVMIRVMAFLLPPDLVESVHSLVFSLDTIAMVVIYFLPRFWAREEDTSNVSVSINRFAGNLHQSSALFPESSVFQFRHGALSSAFSLKGPNLPHSTHSHDDVPGPEESAELRNIQLKENQEDESSTMELLQEKALSAQQLCSNSSKSKDSTHSFVQQVGIALERSSKERTRKNEESRLQTETSSSSTNFHDGVPSHEENAEQKNIQHTENQEDKSSSMEQGKALKLQQIDSNSS